MICFLFLRSETGAGRRNSEQRGYIHSPVPVVLRNIELTLVVGVHGPQQLHVILVA